MNPYNIDTSERNIRAPIIALKVLYDGMPETTGCERCEEVNKENAIWCCRFLNPHMYYVEFLHIWEDIQNWSKEQRAALILRAIRSHLTTVIEKGCIAWDGKCLVYERRPFACRMYGVISSESWEARIAALRQRCGDDVSQFHNVQCNLVSAQQSISKEQEDRWFMHTKLCEARIGVSRKAIQAHDESGGSYHTLHDHLLLELFDEGFLTRLSLLRLQEPQPEEVDSFIELLAQNLQKNGVI